MKRSMFWVLVAGVCLAALDRSVALAQQAPAAPPKPAADPATIGKLVVTAQKRAESLQDVPIAMAAVTGTSLEKRDIANLQDLAASIPDVSVQQRRGEGIVTLRGIGFDIASAGADPGVAVHQDGIYIARPFAALAGFYDVKRVEVARGPQGTLHGRNATGGAVNVISRAPTEDPSGYLDVTAGNFNQVAVEGAVSGPVAGNTLTGRLSFHLDDHDGYGKTWQTARTSMTWPSAACGCSCTGRQTPPCASTSARTISARTTPAACHISGARSPAAPRWWGCAAAASPLAGSSPATRKMSTTISSRPTTGAIRGSRWSARRTWAG